MPKRNSNVRAKSVARKPLLDISNEGEKSSIPLLNKKKISVEEVVVGTKEDDKALDRLLLAHSDLSNLINQIDELVVQAFKVKLKSKKEREEIESFTHVLSDMHSTLKAWVPRFQNALSSPTAVPENQIGKSSPSKTTPTSHKKVSDVSDSLELDLSTLISPSPLVSWCADRTVENGRQLFLLTPLPRSKALSSMRRNTSASVFKRVTHMDAPPNTTLGLPSLWTISANTNDDLLEGVDIKPTPKKGLGSFAELGSTLENGVLSTPKFSKGNKSTFLMTPRLKMSPPKSCVLLEPISESFHHDFNNNRKSTLFPVRSQISSPDTSEPSTSYTSESLALKYPELFGIKQTSKKSGITRKEIETSLENWFMSPPKSCVLMEPPNEKVSIDILPEFDSYNLGPVRDEISSYATVARNQDFQAASNSNAKYLNQELLNANTSLLESTPMWKELNSTGKHHGENTLKRELWTKFEAASSNELHFDLSIFQETETKGFLDRLEEVSCER